MAGYIWTNENLEYALGFVHKNMISPGISVCGYRWFAGDPGAEGKPSIRSVTVGANEVLVLINTFHPRIEWDATDRSSWFYFYRDATREWVFHTDARTFKERHDLAAQNAIQGFGSWVLGKEDPAIWELLPEHP